MSRGEDSVSVVIPCYNYGRFVCEAVDSALSQTHPHAEVIVVDDGSTDDTRDRLVPYGDRIRYIRQENKGLSAARNTGIRHATGEWVALLDADDWWHKQKLEMQLQAVAGRDDVGLLGSPSGANLPETLPFVAHPNKLGVRDFLLSSRFGPSGAMIRRRCFDSVGLFNEELRSIEDRDMWLRIAARFPSVWLNSPCWWYRQHPGQMNRNADRMFRNYQRVLGDFFGSHPEHRGLYRIAQSYLYFDASWSYFEQGQRLAAIAKLFKSIWLRPSGLGDDKLNDRFIRARIALRMLAGKVPVVNA
jgi:glycosyltransferase involved in cell wall biosynthesis